MSDCSTLSDFNRFNAECPISASINDDIFEIPNNHFLSTRDIDRISKSIKETLASYYT